MEFEHSEKVPALQARVEASSTSVRTRESYYVMVQPFFFCISIYSIASPAGA